MGSMERTMPLQTGAVAATLKLKPLQAPEERHGGRTASPGNGRFLVGFRPWGLKATVGFSAVSFWARLRI